MITGTLAAFLAAVLLGIGFTRLVCRLAPKVGLVDHPDDQRKLHQKAVPLGGGLAVFLASGTVLLACLLVPNPWGLTFMDDWRDLWGFLVACSGLVMLGLADDWVGLRGRHKLLGQVAAALVLVLSGVVIRRLGLFGHQVDLGVLSIPFTLFWLVGATNAINLLDGIDGLAATLGVILSATIAVMASITGHAGVAMVALVFAGSLLGFLRYNFPPAKIFLGDAGSMLIGLLVGAMAIRASLKGPGTLLLAAPLALWSLPIFDSVAAILRRKLTGRSIYATDRGHLHHRLLAQLGTSSKAVLLVAACCLFTSAAALAGVALKNDLIALVSVAAVVSMFVVTGTFGRAELLLFAGRLRHFGASLLRPVRGRNGRPYQSAVRLQGSRPWETLWATLTEAAEKLRLGRIVLDVDDPAAHESYIAVWQRPAFENDAGCWRLELPLAVASHRVGRLTIVGEPCGTSGCQDIEGLVDLVTPFEERLRTMAARDAQGLYLYQPEEFPESESEQPDLPVGAGQVNPKV